MRTTRVLAGAAAAAMALTMAACGDSDDSGDGGPGGPGGDGSSPPGAAPNSQGTEHRAEGSDGLLRRLFGFESDRGITEAGRRNGYGDAGDGGDRR